MDLKTIIETNDTSAGRRFDLFIQILIVISLVLFSIETLPSLAPTTRHVLNIIEAVIVVIFTLEYILRLYVADKKIEYIFSFYGVIDLLAILPFYIFSGQGLWALRILRVLRVFMLLKMLRYNTAVKRFGRAFVIVREEIIVFSLMTMMLLYLSAVGIYYFEHEAQPEAFNSIFHSLWWSVATLTTVGYGDVYPITVAGRIFTFVVLMLGLGIIALPAGLFASALSRVRQEELEEQHKKDRNNAKENYCACCGRAYTAKKGQEK